MEVCLSVIFNHKYNKNISILEKIYKERFSNLFYIVPFNVEKIEGISADRVISVYETSYCFQGYISQAYEKIKNEKYTHYLFIGDDQILNPMLNENNIINEFGMNDSDSYIKEIIPYDEITNGSLKDQSNKLYNILGAFNINCGVSYKNEIPNYEEACLRCEKHGLRVAKRLPFSFFCNKGLLAPKYLPLTIVTMGINRGNQLRYPLFKAYSDMIIIDKNSMDEFCRLSGVFAAMNIFVETAIPLAMILSCEKIKTEKDINGWTGIEYWNKEIPIFEEKNEYNLKKLYKNFGEKIIYHHPIKLSKWSIDE